MLLRVIQLLHSQVNYYIDKDERRGSGGHVNGSHCVQIILIKYLVEKLLGIVNRFFISLIQSTCLA